MSIANSNNVFKSYRSYWDFAKKVKLQERFIYNQEVEDFLSTVIKTSSTRETKLDKGGVLWRAQKGYDEIIVDEQLQISVPTAFSPNRMKPLKDKAREGRANPKGIPYLYLATERTSAISEVRPRLGSYVSVALFTLKEDINIIDCSSDVLEKRGIYLGNEPSDSIKESHVWSDINEAYSTPIEDTDDSADYIPTQILSELFKNHGYEGIAYKSRLGAGHNLVIFDLDAVEFKRCELHQVKNISIDHVLREY